MLFWLLQCSTHNISHFPKFNVDLPPKANIGNWLLEQEKQNKIRTGQSLGLAIAQGKENPSSLTNIVKGLLLKSQSCRDYVSTVDYSDIE